MGMIMSIGNADVRRVILKNADGTAAGTISITKPNKKKLKKLQYNFKEISTQIMRTQTSGNAKQVMLKARCTTAILRRKVKTGEYDDKELEMAINHAEQMVRIARKRMKHLQEEENVKRQGGVCQAEPEEEKEAFYPEDMEEQNNIEPDSEEIQELMQELMQKVQEKQDELEKLENTDGLEELSAAGKKMDPADLKALKKKHRADEMREIAEADIKYLRSFFDKLEKEKQEAFRGVSLELAGISMQVPDVEMPAAPEGTGIDVSV